jgi:putative ABC transport system permease protein
VLCAVRIVGTDAGLVAGVIAIGPKHQTAGKKGHIRSAVDCIAHAVSDFKRHMIHSATAMFRSTLRRMRNHKAYTITNIAGLSVGLAIAFLIVGYIQCELSYDKFHEKGGRLYRISVVHKKQGTIIGESSEFTPPIGPAMRTEFPEVENYARISTLRPAYLSYKTRVLRIEGIAFADSTLFDLFSFTLLEGNPRRALAEPFSIVLTKEFAVRFFGDTSPIGQTMTLDNDRVYTVTGVMQRPPVNSHIQFDALISFSTLYRLPNLFLGWDGGNQYITYVLLNRNAAAGNVQRRFPDFMWKNINSQLSGVGVSIEPSLQPLPDIHLWHNPDSRSVRTNMYVFAAIALLILFIACVNFINLAVAQAVPRSREVGIRKVLGATRGSLVRQFLAESLVLSGAAVLVALLFVEILSGIVGKLTGQTPWPDVHAGVSTGGVLLGLSLLVALGSGLYPAFYLSSMETVWTLKGGTLTFTKASRNVLVVLQFAISVSLVVSTLIIARQVEFVKTRELGFTKENIVVLHLVGEQAQARSEALKGILSQVPGVVAVAASSDVPYQGFTSNGYFPEGSSTPMMIHVVDVDDAFLATYGIEVVQGRGFTGVSRAEEDAILINETLAQTLNWDEPVGKRIRRGGEHEVIGVVRDFHFATLHDRIAPLIITRRPWLDRFSRLSVRLNTADIQRTMAGIKEAWEHVVPASPFSYFFLDDAFDHLYRREERFLTMFGWFSLLAIIIASLGLMSLVAISVRQRTKEIGIRKVLGASVPGIIGLISTEYAKLVIAATLIAWPAAAYLMNAWLEGFAYRIDLPWWAFFLSGCGALAAALVVIWVQSFRTVMTNPVEALRYE